MKFTFLCSFLAISLLILSACGNTPERNIRVDLEKTTYKPPHSFAAFNPPVTDSAKILAGYKLNNLKGNLSKCMSLLKQANASYTKLPDETVSGCRLTERVELNRSNLSYASAMRATCPLIAGIVLWENSVLQNAAQKHFGQRVAHVENNRIFSCRNIAGSNRRSEHSKSNAIDIHGFTLANGEKISLLKDWGKRNAKGRFLRDVKKGSCKIFQVVLSPEYNKAHADHFHFDMLPGDYKICN